MPLIHAYFHTIFMPLISLIDFIGILELSSTGGSRGPSCLAMHIRHNVRMYSCSVWWCGVVCTYGRIGKGSVVCTYDRVGKGSVV